MVTHLTIALLTNFLPPYRIPVLKKLSSFCGGRLFILLSTPMEEGRFWTYEDGGLNVVVQKSITFKRPWRHPNGFADSLSIHFPLDTFSRLRSIKPDVIITAEFGFRTLLALFYRLLHPDTRVTVWATLSEHTEQGRGLLRYLIRRFVIRFSDRFIVNGKSGARYLSRLGAPSSRIRIIPQSTDIGPFLAIARPENVSVSSVLRIICSGMLIERKGLLPFLKTLVEVVTCHPTRTVELCFAGHGPLANLLSSFPTPPNLRLRFLGNVPYDTLPSLYKTGDLLAFPTLADEWGMVVVEAMASGLPVLGSVFSQAVEELVEPEKSGWLFRPTDASSMRFAVESAILAPSSVIRAYGLEARRQVSALSAEAIATLLHQSTTDVPSSDTNGDHKNITNLNKKK